MATLIKISSQVLLVGFILFCLVVDVGVVAKGGGRGGGGGGRGGSRGGSRSGGSRGSSGRSSSTATKVGIVAGAYFGSRVYMSRRRYRDGDHEPTVCVNTKYQNESDNSEPVNGQFICPMEDEPDSYSYCCGDESAEHCCGFWDSGGRVAGAVIGILIAIVFVAVFLYCCCIKRLKNSSRNTPNNVFGKMKNLRKPRDTGQKHNGVGEPYPTTTGQPYLATTEQPYPTTTGQPYPTTAGQQYTETGLPYPTTAQSYPESGQPYPPYPSNTGLPYPTNPAMPQPPPSYDMATGQERY